MKPLKSLYHRVLLPACLFFTILCFVISTLHFTSKTEMTLPTISLGNLAQIFLFCLLFALSNLLFVQKKLRFSIALILHFFLFLFNISIIFFLIGKHYQSASGAFTLLLLFALVYILVSAIVVTIRHFVRSTRAEANPYKKQFR